MSASGREPGGEGDLDPALEELLRRLPPPAPGAPFRARARRAFLAGAGSRADEGVRTPEPMQQDLEAFERWLAAQPLAAPPRPEFRARLRQRFLSGAWAPPADEAAPGEAPARAPARVSRRRRLLAWTLAAAAIAAVTLYLPEPARWDVRVAGSGPVRLAARDYLPDELRRLAVGLEGAGTLESLANEVTLVLGDGRVELRLLPGSTLALPRLPDVEAGDRLEVELLSGEVYAKTGAGFPGQLLGVRTRHAEVGPLGTVFGILIGESGTCVCVARGEVGIASPLLPEGAQRVGPGWSCFVHAERGEPTLTPFPGGPGAGHPGELAHTAALAAFAAE